MMSDILNFMIDAITACNNWFLDIINATGAASVIVGFVSVCLAARFILMPIVGGAGFRAVSDKAKRIYDRNQNTED